MDHALFEQLYRGETRPYEASIGAHPHFSVLRALFTNQNIFQLNQHRPYPIDLKIVQQSGYHRRPDTEVRLFRGLKDDANRHILVVVGPEGCGKTTAMHYTLGRYFPDTDVNTFLQSYFLHFDVKEWYGFKNHQEIFNHVLSQIDLKLAFPPVRDLLDTYSNTVRSNAELYRMPSIEGPLTAQSAAAFFGILSTGILTPNLQRKMFLIFDNADTLAKPQQVALFQAVQSLMSQITSYRDFLIPIMDLDGSNNLHIVLTLRPETQRTLFQNSSGLNWPPNEEVTIVDLTRLEDLNPWDLATSRIEFWQILKTADLNRMRVALRIGTKKEFEDTIADPKQYILDMISWLRQVKVRPESEIAKFCGMSVRRRLMFAFKILGHPNLRLAFYNERILKQLDQISKEVIWDAMYDFNQPLGSSSPFNHRPFLLNAYLVVPRDLMVNAPLIGSQILLFLHTQREHEFIYRSELFSHLTPMGYTKRAVNEALETFSHCKLLSPVFSEGPDVPAFYIIDQDALGKYIDLISARRIRETFFFVTHAIREIFGLTSYIPPSYHLEKAHLALYFLYEVNEANGRLRTQILSEQSGNEGRARALRVPNYAKIVGPPLFRHASKLISDFEESVLVSGKMKKKLDHAKMIQKKIAWRYSGFLPDHMFGKEG